MSAATRSYRDQVAQAFSPLGALSQQVSGFAPRDSQLQMADAVAQAIEQQQTLLVEAGTGTGKTFAYLVPSLLTEGKVLIATATKALQDQLFTHDLPRVRDALGRPCQVALLKGRSNYLCLYRLELHATDGRFSSAEVVTQLQQVQRWAKQTREGDIAELATLSEDAPVWPYVTSSIDNCLGQDCPSYSDCHVVKARQAALEADVCVINHHLFFADMALREEGVTQLLPGADVVILDEAHQAPEIASQFFGQRVSARQLSELTQDVTREYLATAIDSRQLLTLAETLDNASRHFRLALGVEVKRGPWASLAVQEKVQEALEDLQQALDELAQGLEPQASRSKGLDSCWRRAQQFGQLLTQVTQVQEQGDGQVHWYETFTKSFSLNMTPLSVAEPMQHYAQSSHCSWIFTSATLAVDGGFEHFAQQLGLQAPEEVILPSPFDYAQQSLLYVPRSLPDPNNPSYVEQMMAAVVPVLMASEGRAFLLFTSHRAMQLAYEGLRERVELPLLVQGEAPKQQLLDQFKQTPQAVLLATGSFWQGVDVRGDALVCVVIDRLPFAAPDDPLLSARLSALRQGGQDPFMAYQLPQAILTLKQGAGRLIRDPKDYGVLMVCDPRLVAKPYGQQFIQSLPQMPRTRDLALVESFFAAWQGEKTHGTTGD